MKYAGNSTTLTKLCLKRSHHINYTVIYHVQNVFTHPESKRTVSPKFHYNVIFRNRRHINQFRKLPYQIFSFNGLWLLDEFNYSTRPPNEYLVLDCHHTND